MLVAENEVISNKPLEIQENETPGPTSDAIVGHLDKSHYYRYIPTLKIIRIKGSAPFAPISMSQPAGRFLP
jgi:hypothetical protein